MNRLSIDLCNRIFPSVLARACKSTIPRSGDEGAKVNCFVTSIDKDGQPYLIVLGLFGSELECIEWDGSRYQIQRRVPLASFHLADFEITHYYGHSQITYAGVADFLLGRVTAWPYIKIHVVRWLYHIDQYLFNKKKLITKQRMDLLKFLVDRALDGKTEHQPLDLMTDLHTMKWYLHPQGEQQQQKLEFYLDSLVETGELKRINFKYVVSGQALRTIEEYEEQERKHTESVKMQWRMFWLTLAIAVLTFVQAGVVKLPALIDFTSK
jgi:hypothetical protein